MADLQIKVKDSASANAWLQKIMLLNEDYHAAMAEASETLTSVKDFSDGTMVDEIYNFGSGLLSAAETTFSAINTIAETVTSVISTVKNFESDVVSGIGRLAGSLLGL